MGKSLQGITKEAHLAGKFGQEGWNLGILLQVPAGGHWPTDIGGCADGQTMHDDSYVLIWIRESC